MTVAEYNSKYGEIPLKRPANVTIDQWDKAINLYNVAKSKGDKFPELTVAQAALETGWFKSPSGSFNYFGQKATQSQKGTDFNTKEVSGNQAYSTRARFRDYENLGEAVDDRVKKWSSKYANAENIDQAIGSIWQYDPQTGQGRGYATDDKYDVKLKSILGMMGVESNPSQPRQEPIINTEVSNLQNTQQIPTFASNVPPLPIQPTKEEEKAEKKVEKEEDSKEKNALKQKQKEYEFLQEAIAKLTEVPQQRQQEQPQQEELRIPDIMQRYNEVSKVVETPVLQQGGQIPVSREGVREYPEQQVIVPSPNITMIGVDYPIKGKSLETGEEKIMLPNSNHFFKNTQNVLETPVMQQGGTKYNWDERREISPSFLENFKKEEKYSVSEDGILMEDLPEVVINTKRKPVELASINIEKDKDTIPEREIVFNTVKESIPNISQFFTKSKVDLESKEWEENFKLEELMEIMPGLKDNPEKVITIGGDTFTSYGQLPEVEIRAKKKFDIDSVREGQLDQLGRGEIEALQRELDKRGLLPTNYERIKIPKGRENVKELQEMLVRSGYDLGKFGVNSDGVDGIAGKKTKEAVEKYNEKASGVDGIIGDKTKQALREYNKEKLNKNVNTEKVQNRFFEMSDSSDIVGYQNNLEKQGYFKGIENYRKAGDKDIEKREIQSKFGVTDGDTCSSTMCTYFVGQEIENKVKEKGRERLDAYGDAWTISDRLIRQGAKEVYSLFPENKPNLSSSQIEPYLKGRIENSEKIDSNTVESGDVVNLFYEGSGYKNEAYEKGSKYFTSHLGIVKEDSKGKKIVEHNVGGKIFREPLEDLINRKSKTKGGGQLAITAIVRPDYQIGETQEFYDSSQARVNEDTVSNFSTLGSKESAKFTQTLVMNQEKLQKDIPINKEEFDNIARAAKAIGWKESGFNSEIDSTSLFNQKGLRKIAGEVREKIGKTELSRGVTQMKDKQNLTENLRNKYVKGKGENLSNPEEAAIPTFYALSARYLYLKDLSTVKNIDITSEELTKLAMLAWNEPIDIVAKSLEKYKTYNNTIAAYRGEQGSHPYDLALNAFDKYLK